MKNQNTDGKNVARYRRASIWLRVGISITMLGSISSCVENNLPESTRSDAIDILQTLFDEVIVNPVVDYVNGRIEDGLNSAFGTAA